MNEKERVMYHSMDAHYNDAGVMLTATEYCCEIFLRHIREGSILELGPAEGIMTDMLAPGKEDYTVVDAAEFFVKDIIKRHQNVKGYTCLFEEFKPTKYYMNIILGHVLEHVEKPVDILKLCKTWLADGGVILCAVPNSHSLHRQAAVSMGMLESEKTLNEKDMRNGHRRVYDYQTLKKDFTDAGLNVVNSGGYWLKPLSNGQIDASWSLEMINAFMKLGEEYPDIAGEIYVIGEKVVL